MSLPRPTGLKPPSKIGKPTGLPQPRSSGTGIPTPSSTSKAQSAIAKSARAAGLSSNLAEKYAADVVQQLPVKRGPDLPPPPPADDFIVGDRVWVSGTKPGFIAYIGETQFATGDWAGVVLDKPEGKNDGSVQGVRYFQCEPKRGVFSRITKLSRTPGIVSATPNPDGASEGVPANVRTTNGNSNMSQTLPHARPTTPKLSMSRTLSSSSSSLHKASPTAPSQNIVPKSTSSGVGKQLKIGDRVLVSGTKTGTLRYMGATDFAKGDWAGVELDEKQGKNDGAVAGKRYFDCKPMYGLFAPVHKVTKLASGNAGHVMSASTPSPQTRSLVNTGLRLSRERSGSQESVSSISSTASSVSRSRLPLRQKRRLQLDTPVAKNRPSTLNLTATTQALQKALKEKEEHIEQLLRERDLERAEVARAAAQVDEAEGQLTSMKQEQMRQRDESEENVTKLRAFIQSLEQEKADILCKLEDEKRKVEDLQFQIEEEAITKDDLESRTEEEEAKLRNLERDLKKEKERADKYEQEFYTVKAMLKDNKEALASTEEMNMSYLDQIEELTHKLSQAESTVKNYEATRLEEGAKNSQVSIELVEKSNRIIELEDILSNRNKEVKDLHHRIHEVEDELKSSKNKKNKMQETIENLNSQLAHRDEASNNLTSEIQNLKSQLSDLQRRLDASNHNNEQLQDEKRQIEQQMSEMMKNSGDSSQKLSMLNDQVQEKNRKIQDLQAALSNSTQQLGKLNDEIENLKQATLRERENLVLKNEEISKTYQGQLEDLQVELDKANTKMQQMNESHKKEKDDSLGRKIREIEELKKQLQQSIEEQEKQEVQTQAHKQVLEKITMEKEALQFEKEKGEKLTKRLESEKESLNAELVHAKAEVSKVQEECQKVNAESKQLQEQMQDVKSDLEKMTKSKNEIQNQVSSIETERDKATEERDNLRREGMESKVTLQQKDMLIGELQKEVEKMKSEVQNSQETIMQMSHEESSLQELQSQLNESSRQYEELQKSMHEVESERDTMRAQLQFSNLVAEEKRRLEDQNQQLSIEAERTELRFRKEIETLEGSNSTLRDELGDVKEQLLGKDREVESFKQQVANLKNENISLESYRMSVQKMEKERGEFQEKISRLEASLSEAKTISPNMNSIAASDNSAVGPLQEEKTALQGQVDFLNSVIVDLQQKNKDLTHKMEVLESGIITNGDHDSSLETDLPKSRAPPRLFCDICDVFDQHDTDDCPLQAMDYDDDDTPSPSHHHGDRKASRPYCDICEVFGHWTESCDDGETF